MADKTSNKEEITRKINEMDALVPKPDRTRNLGGGLTGLLPYDEGAEAGRQSAVVFKTSLQEFKRSFKLDAQA